MTVPRTILYASAGVACLVALAIAAGLIPDGATPLGLDRVGDNSIAQKDLFNASEWRLHGKNLHISGGGATPPKIALRGDGEASGFSYAASAPIAVRPYRVYRLTGDIDGSAASAGEPSWAIFTLDLKVGIANAPQSPGARGQVSVYFIAPSGAKFVRILCDAGDAVVVKNAALSFSNPVLQLVDR